MKYSVFADPQHAWVRVPRLEILALGLGAKISCYSYEKGPWVYLEEDCDFPAFIRANLERDGCALDSESMREWAANNLGKESHTNNSSRIRSFPAYAPRRAFS